MSHEQISPEIESILQNNDDNNRKSYHSSKVVEEKKYDSILQPAGTKIEVEQAKYIKQNVLNNNETMWRGYGNELRRLLQKGIDQDKKERDKQQQPTITTTYKKGKKKHRGDVKVNLIQIKEYLLKGNGGVYVKGDSPVRFGLTKIRSAIETLEVNDPRTVEEYVCRVCSGCGDAIAVGTRDSVFNLTHFFERDDLMPTKPKSKKNKNLGEFC